MTDRPTGTVTFLFTDIEGSTRLWEEHPDRMEIALEQHDRLLRTAIEAHGGYVFSTAGDAFAASFARADEAMMAAIAAQEALSGASWPVPSGLRARIGLHTGEGQERGGDYFGPALNQAARVMAAANGGQVVVSAVTQQLVGDRIAAPYRTTDLGEHRLKDLSLPQRLFAVTGGALPEVRLPLRTIDGTPGNLPSLLPPFIGRESDLDALRELVVAHRLVTVLGPPGTGKTRIAIQVAAEVAAEFPGGVWLVDLSPERDPEGVAQAIARALGVAPDAGLAPEVGIVEALRYRPALLILDNCESALRPAAALAEQLLGSCSDLRILVTSREVLRSRTERVFPLGPMSTQRADGQPDAVAFFIDRARAQGASDEQLAPHGAALAELCARLDGLPLAIELAAARARSVDPAQLLAHLDQRFRVLRTSGPASDARHHTLRSAIDWSYDLLDERDRALFRRISVFDGPFQLADAVAVTDDEVDALDVLDGLSSLVDRSMVVAIHGAAPTFRLLETLRLYGAEVLAAQGETEDARRRHAEHFAARALEARGATVTSHHVATLDMLVLQTADYRKATVWALECDDRDLAVRLAVGFCGASYYRIGYEALDWLGRAPADLAESDRPLSVELLGLVARRALFHGDASVAEELAHRAIAMDPGPESVQARAQLSLIASRSGDNAAMVTWSQSAVDVSEQSGDDLGLLLGLLLLGPQLAAMQRIDEAIAVGERLLKLGEERGSDHALGWGHYVLGRTLAAADPGRSREHLALAVALGSSEKNRYLESNARLAQLETRLTLDAPEENAAAALSALQAMQQLRASADNGFFTRLVLGEVVYILASLRRAEAILLDAHLRSFAETAPPAQRRRRRAAVEGLVDDLGETAVRQLSERGAGFDADTAFATAVTLLEELISDRRPGSVGPPR